MTSVGYAKHCSELYFPQGLEVRDICEVVLCEAGAVFS